MTRENFQKGRRAHRFFKHFKGWSMAHKAFLTLLSCLCTRLTGDESPQLQGSTCPQSFRVLTLFSNTISSNLIGRMSWLCFAVALNRTPACVLAGPGRAGMFS